MGSFNFHRSPPRPGSYGTFAEFQDSWCRPMTKHCTVLSPSPTDLHNPYSHRKGNTYRPPLDYHPHVGAAFMSQAPLESSVFCRLTWGPSSKSNLGKSWCPGPSAWWTRLGLGIHGFRLDCSCTVRRSVMVETMSPNCRLQWKMNDDNVGN